MIYFRAKSAPSASSVAKADTKNNSINSSIIQEVIDQIISKGGLVKSPTSPSAASNSSKQLTSPTGEDKESSAYVSYIKLFIFKTGGSAIFY